MLRIGEAAKNYNISNRTLRYWDDEGVLKSTRAENGYRYYDHENAMRIKQIVLLRKLKMPIADIERVFISNDLNVAIDALTSHLKSLRNESVVLDSLAVLIEKLIQHINSQKSLDQVFLYLEAQTENAFFEHRKALQILLSERNIIMSANQMSNVRIVNLPAMTVMSYRAESDTPEKDCSDVINKFVLENSLHKTSGFRHFGFNNPSPTEGSTVYGYEMWVAVPKDYAAPKPFIKKHFEGGLYASIPTNMSEIGERWQQLNNWVMNSDTYDMDMQRQWLEECIDFETFTSGDESVQQLDLLEPIKRK